MVLFIVLKYKDDQKNEKMICLKLVDRMNIVYIILLWNQKMNFMYI